jgi:hypothetical protein
MVFSRFFATNRGNLGGVQNFPDFFKEASLITGFVNTDGLGLACPIRPFNCIVLTTFKEGGATCPQIGQISRVIYSHEAFSAPRNAQFCS